MKIIIIEDDRSFYKLLTLKLKNIFPNSTFISFDSLNKARIFFKEQNNLSQADLIVIDQHLPDGKGTELLQEGYFQGLPVLSVSSDQTPTVPAETLSAGAMYFLDKNQINQPLFEPLVKGLIQKAALERKLSIAEKKITVIDTVKKLVATLKHEINNPLGAVMGAVYLIENTGNLTEEQKKAALMIEESGKRIKKVLDQLLQAVELEVVEKGSKEVFHIPGDKKWE